VKVRVGSSSRKLPLVGKFAVGGGVCR